MIGLGRRNCLVGDAHSLIKALYAGLLFAIRAGSQLHSSDPQIERAKAQFVPFFAPHNGPCHKVI